MQLSRVDHFFILTTILKVFHLKFIHYNSRTSCCFHVELLWRIFVCNFLIHFVSVTQMIFFLYKPLYNIFLTFSDLGLELTQMIFLSFWSKLEKWRDHDFCLHCEWKRTTWSSWNSRACLFEPHSVFDMLFFALRAVVELLGHVCLNFTLFHFIVFFLIWNTHHVVRELLVIITLNFSLVWENYFKTQKTTYIFYVFWTSKYTVNLLYKNFWTSWADHVNF